MKWSITAVLAALVASATVNAFDIKAFGARALKNLNQTPACAQMCIFNPKWARTYAPECADIPLGVEYATKLCQNYMYQHMLDSCFKEKCSDGDRKKVIWCLFQIDFRLENWERILVLVMGSMFRCRPGKDSRVS